MPAADPRASLQRLRSMGRLSCRYCGSKTRKHLTLEHLTPLSRGGTWRMSNCDVSCWQCNILKGDRTDDEFKDLIGGCPGGIEQLKREAPGLQKGLRDFVSKRKAQYRRNQEARIFGKPERPAPPPQQPQRQQFDGAAAELAKWSR